MASELVRRNSADDDTDAIVSRTAPPEVWLAEVSPSQAIFAVSAMLIGIVGGDCQANAEGAGKDQGGITVQRCFEGDAAGENRNASPFIENDSWAAEACIVIVGAIIVEVAAVPARVSCTPVARRDTLAASRASRHPHWSGVGRASGCRSASAICSLPCPCGCRSRCCRASLGGSCLRCSGVGCPRLCGPCLSRSRRS